MSRILTTVTAVLATVVGALSLTSLEPAISAPAVAAAASGPALVSTAPRAVLGARVAARGSAVTKAPGSVVPLRSVPLLLTVTTSGAAGKGTLLVAPRSGSGAPVRVAYRRGAVQTTTLIAPLSADHRFTVRNRASVAVRVRITVAGYVAPTTTERLHRIAPARVIDTRRGVGLPRRPVAARSAVAARVTGGAIPAGATGVVLTLSASGVTRPGTIAVQGSSFLSSPRFASLRFSKNGVNSSTVVARPDATGRLHLFNSSPRGVHLTAVVVGYTTAVRPTNPGTPGTPVAVSGLRVSSEPDTVTLRWANPPGTTEVVVRRLAGEVAPTTPNDGTSVPVTGVATSASDTLASPGERYSYSVFARVGGSFTAPASAIRPGPPPPTGGDLTSEPGRLTFRWSNPPGVHHIEVDLVEGGGVRLPRPAGTDLGKAETYTAAGLKERTLYALTVYAVDAAGNTTGSLTISGTTPSGDDQAPAPLSSVSATAQPKLVTLSWVVPPGSEWDHVLVARSDGNVAPASPSSGRLVGETEDQRAAIDDPAVEPGRTYTYALWVRDASGNLSRPIARTVTTPAGAPTGPVTGLRATALTAYPEVEGQSIRLTWTPPAGAASYVIARADGATAPTSTRAAGGWAVPAQTPMFLDTRLPGSKQYSYAVWAVAADGTWSPAATVTVTTDRSTRRLSGRLLNTTTGQPVSAGAMTFRLPDGTSHEATAGADGTYAVDLRVGTLTVCVTGASVRGGGAAHGYVDTCREVTIGTGPATTVDIKVDPAASVTGVATDTRSGRPVAGVRIEVWTIFPPYRPIAQATSDASGRYLISGVPTTGTSLTVTPPRSELAPTWVDVPALTPGQTITRDIALDPLPRIAVSGRVTAATGGGPLEGVAVHLVDPESYGKTYLVGHTGADGRYAGSPYVEDPEGLKLCFEAEGQGRAAAAPVPPVGLSNACFGGVDYDPADRESASTATTVTSGQQASIALRSAATIAGTVRAADGTPLAGVRVVTRITSREVADEADRLSATTDAAGRYVLRTPLPPADVTPPKVSVCAQAGGGGAFGYLAPSCGLEYQVRPTPAQPSITLDISMAPAGGISGVLSDVTTGRPVAGATVTLKRQTSGSPEFGGTTRTGADGRYAFTGLDPAVTYDLCFEGGDDAQGSQAYLEDCVVGESGAEAVRVAPARATQVDRRVGRSATVTGVVTDADTHQPLAGITVGFVRGGDVTDAQGRFTLTGRPAGVTGVVRTGLSATGTTGYQAGEASRPTTLPPDAVVRVDVAVRPAAALRVRVLTQDGRVVPGAAITNSTFGLGREAISDEQGETVWRGLAASPYNITDTVCATSGTAGPGSSAGFTRGCSHLPALVAGRTATATVVVGLRGTIDAVVYDNVTGQPVKSANVTFYKITGDQSSAQVNMWTTASGQAFGFGDMYRSDPPATSTNPLGPTSIRARVCASWASRPVTCVPAGPDAGASGPTVGASPGLRTLVPIGIDAGH
ncbi:hypothetical protein GUY44_13595 [Pimelobacter simplex]|uniref:Uncharacterized protein n=1 Tax=Nocardioides simplex TaxID=2045 RepID=A0A0A1DL09_NOCSI|nr:carboxypeptidase regulatory-like domain-containing protein [Pimelobacter simplex]AIY17268.1 hypothetical protein KR76_11795 [Pimelobacter simplex]MCG8151520.1 hypothetical protein [Pimelobacter simplex]GEB13296.1 hypothetical protein NSI01_16110 [Pimelobacter simplex]SFM46805.1 Carboxypeptidase regulatory-like domain-containing protein [Pimelobacter simplex]